MFARLSACGLALAFLVSAPSHAWAGSPTVTVGNPSQPDSLPQELVDAQKGGADKIVIRTGIYRFSRQGKPIIVLKSWKKVRISGHGVTLVSSETEAGNDLLQLDHCTGVELADLTFSQDSPTAYQGRVSQVSRGPAGETSCVWRPDSDYPSPSDQTIQLLKGLNVVDGLTRSLKIGSGDSGPVNLKASGEGSFQVSFSSRSNVADGDWLVGPSGATPSKVHLIGCHECALSDINLIRNGPNAVQEEEGGGNMYYDCHWQAGVKPDGAAEKPLVASSGAGFRSTGAYPGPDIEDCDFTGAVLDDCFDIHGSYQGVKQASGSTVTLDPGHLDLIPGQPVRASAKGFIANGFVKSVTKNPDGTISVGFDQDLGIPVGALLSNPLKNGQSFKILNCHLGNTRGRGISAMGDSGFIENNLISLCGMSAVSAGPDSGQGEADYVQNLTVKSNQFKNNGFAGGSSAVRIQGDGAVGNKVIDIEGNTFDSDFGGDISIAWASLVTIRNNGFTSPSKRPEGFDHPVPISLSQSKGIRILDNQIKNDLLYAKPLLVIGPEATGVDQVGKAFGG